MDFVSDVVAVMRAGRPSSALVAWHAPFGQFFPEVPYAAGFQIVVAGTPWLVPPVGDPVRLDEGDLVFFPHGHGYGLADSPSRPMAAPVCDPETGRPLLVSDTVGDGDGPATVTLCGGYRLAPGRVHPLLGGMPDAVRLSAGRHPRLGTAIALLRAEAEYPTPGSETAVLALLDLLLVYILRAWSAEQPDGIGWAAALRDPAVSAALSALHDDPARAWTVRTLAEASGLSRAAFARRFTALVGRPPLGYLTWWRMTLAARLLRDTDTSLAHVAARTGYASEYSLSHAFKRAHGVAPGRYRRVPDPYPEPSAGPR
ncbi:AraC-like DNA-binding protein [Actinocorallia herbida]|uniref:AraC-like DNA-binding protein n=1 Tax=Actinocorallia herbida TaxID=58109 RepID=A0A3N1D3U7_9ACTN|nr:AraC family transcriptional regulator [Actinocorallia herbida]ROO88195.1 AraC-like DNA-binding protein [Actinocorallia herbida]